MGMVGGVRDGVGYDAAPIMPIGPCTELGMRLCIDPGMSPSTDAGNCAADICATAGIDGGICPGMRVHIESSIECGIGCATCGPRN